MLITHPLHDDDDDDDDDDQSRGTQTTACPPTGQS
jgi:hypothetical protein